MQTVDKKEVLIIRNDTCQFVLNADAQITLRRVNHMKLKGQGKKKLPTPYFSTGTTSPEEELLRETPSRVASA